jgi:predicted DNA-binding transcriptional regulator AlpA
MNSLPVLDTEEAAYFLHMTPATLRFWRHKGTGPKYFQLGGRKVYYKQDDLMAWVEAQYMAPNPRIHVT